MAIEVRYDHTPNPNAVKFTANQVVFEGTGSYSFKQGEDANHPLAAALLDIEGVDNVFGYQDFVTVNKKADADWDTLIPNVKEAFQKIYG
ncbi:NifU N-terminal domain-containing protein [Pseudalkalibacillus caeni]|uniref:Scaffolding protein n=1 Tax=Exobacillus caeni TaxID=2574798 RepID=A0A5R9F2F3_9BACL|nr:NifU N-terminal domain-containing protein [Pseudalkalibacillus caeni]TLS37852.1 scaffolding protein [Pseudalkalibacillus caeni]